MRLLSIAILSSSIALVTGCNTYHDQLARSQASFERNEHDRTLALLRDLERDVTKLPLSEQAQYAFLRGMTDYRMGFRADARHWLSIAKAMDDNSPGLLPAAFKAQTVEALAEMNQQVWTDGIASLAAVSPSDDTSTKK